MICYEISRPCIPSIYLSAKLGGGESVAPVRRRLAFDDRRWCGASVARSQLDTYVSSYVTYSHLLVCHRLARDRHVCMAHTLHSSTSTASSLFFFNLLCKKKKRRSVLTSKKVHARKRKLVRVAQVCYATADYSGLFLTGICMHGHADLIHLKAAWNPSVFTSLK